MYQSELTFFEQGKNPTREEKQWFVSEHNPNSPLNKFIGNKQAINRLRPLAYKALGRQNHCCRDLSLAFLGPASTGKTTVAKLFAKTVGLPFVELHPRELSSAYDIFLSIKDTCAEWGLELVEIKPNFYQVPSSIVFIDEVHALRKRLVDALLKPTESKDAVLVARDPKKGHKITVNCWHVCWMVATTDRGDLPHAFDTRFTKIQMKMYTLAEVAEIIHFHNPHLDEEVCELIAKFGGRVPREALDFATAVELRQEMVGKDWIDVVHMVRQDHGIDEFGMSERRVKILKALADKGSIPLGRLTHVAQCGAEELRNYVLPILLEFTDDRNALISVSSRGYSITEAGIEELKKRHISVRKSA